MSECQPNRAEDRATAMNPKPEARDRTLKNICVARTKSGKRNRKRFVLKIRVMSGTLGIAEIN